MLYFFIMNKFDMFKKITFGLARWSTDFTYILNMSKSIHSQIIISLIKALLLRIHNFFEFCGLCSHFTEKSTLCVSLFELSRCMYIHKSHMCILPPNPNVLPWYAFKSRLSRRINHHKSHRFTSLQHPDDKCSCVSLDVRFLRVPHHT